MANNKMLIDASHPEETRVVVVRGNRIEEFDFEAQDRRQLRGNIYLAKVTRVEPSLQAAFIDYGGNRHGFLAFSEIHPDYYQIPAADRQALLDAEAEAAYVEDDEQSVGIEEAASSGNEEDDEDENGGGKKRSRRKPRRGRGRKSRDDQEASAENTDAADPDSDGDASSDDNTADEADPEVADSDAVTEAAEEETPKPRKRARRPRKKKSDDEANATEAAKAPAEADDSPVEIADTTESDDVDDSESGSTTMAAMMDMDVISEDAPEEDPSEEGSPEAEPEPKPKRKPRARRPKKAETQAATEEAATEATSEQAGGEEAGKDEAAEAETAEKPKKRTRRKPAAKKKADSVEAADGASETTVDAAGDASSDTSDEPAAEEKPKKRRSRRKKADTAENAEKDSSGDDNGNGDDGGKSFESVGREDALEEVAVKRPRRQYKIQEVIKRRQVMLVQVVKEERGNKGAALTTYLSLAGRYSVLMPNTARGGGISRKITNPADRKRLKEIAGSLDVPKGMGVILRTAGASLEREEIERDFDYLMRLWENVRELTLESSAPYLVYEEGSLIKRSIRDLYNKDIGEIIVSGEEGYNEAKEFMQMLMPGHGRNVKFYQGEQPLLAKFNIESQLDKMVTPQVTLKSGGYLIINQTEALVAIDVNSGRSTREHSIEATALQTNLEAAEEVARQLRLRDLAGLVVIDFIDMEEKRNNRSVERKLKECLKNDRARIQVGHISHFGLLEMSRQRIRVSVLESTMAVCPTCQGVGHIRSEPSFGLHILRGIDDHLNRHSRNDVIVKVPPPIALYILNNKRTAVTELEDRYGVKISFESDHTIDGQEFVIEKGEPASRTPRKAAAVNPMHVEDRDPEDSADVPQADQAPGDEDDNGTENKRGRRRRGRGRGRNRDHEDNRASEEDAGARTSGETDDADAPASQPSEKTATQTAPEAADDEPPVKKRRGRKKTQQSQEESPVAAAAVEAPTDTGSEASEELSNSRRRTGRPGRKAKSEAESAEVAKTAETGEDESRKGSPPREVKRRNTRRIAKPKDDASGENDEAQNESSSWSGGFLS